MEECDYEMVVSTDPTEGSSDKLFVLLEMIGGGNINTTNVVKSWDAMGCKYTYFLPNSMDRLQTRRECVGRNFCGLGIRGKKGKPVLGIRNHRVTEPRKECDYEMVVSTGATRGPSHKLFMLFEMIGGGNINTTDVVKNWGAMGRKYTYFLPNSVDRFKTRRECVARNFCAIGLKGKKGELKPHWYINNITVTTTGDRINRFREFSFRENNEVPFINPIITDGECP
ncbi:hypothetical protein GIB67_036238 [Kingdonia uniflora]|uniref:Uncharacterized protein n=1 Tax=Kingdonia uniflora TaxID=39325 RepID=A0A7J7NU12_9MAGN|nr:hypothetical protein GIB67_036238 [Kingdonia uniflora]